MSVCVCVHVCVSVCVRACVCVCVHQKKPQHSHHSLHAKVDSLPSIIYAIDTIIIIKYVST